MDIDLSGYDLDIVAAAITAHSLKDDFIPECMKNKNINTEDFHKVLSVLKDADGLDRVRLCVRALCLDYIRNKESYGLVKTAIFLLNRTGKINI